MIYAAAALIAVVGGGFAWAMYRSLWGAVAVGLLSGGFVLAYW